MKTIMLLLGLAIGFGGGVYWGVHHQEQASDLAKKEEEWVLKGKMQATQAITQKLDQALKSQSSSAAGAPAGSGFLGAAPGGANDALRQLRDEQQQQLQSMQNQLQAVAKK